MPLEYRKDIDGLRALAVLAVLLFYCNLGLTGGFVGVDIFYVISGYLIVGLIEADLSAGRFSFRRFYERRIRRLYPALFLVLAVTSVWAVWRMLWVDLQDYARSLLSVITYLSNVQFYRESGYFTEEATIKPLLHTWSLAVEEQFYLIVPPLLVLAHRWLPRRGRIGLWAVLVALSFALCVVVIGRDKAAAFYLLPTRAWELGLGGLVALTGTAWVARSRPLAEMLGLGGLAAILWAMINFNGNVPFPDERAALPVLGAVAVIMAGSGRQTLVARLLSISPAVFIGRISYPLYLWHWPLIVMVVYGRYAPLSRKEALIVIAGSLILSVLTWWFVEQPIRGRRWLPQARPLFAMAVAASVGIAGFSAVLLVAKGFPGRHDPALVTLVEGKSLLDKNAWSHDQRACHLKTASRLSDGSACIRGAKGVAPTFALVGDSHADAASPGIFAAAQRLELSGWQLTMPGLLLTPGRHPIGSTGAGGQREALDFLTSHPDVRVIILTGWWARAITGRSYRDSPTIFVDEEYRGTGLADNPRSFATAMERLAESFPDRLIVILDDVPFGRLMDMKNYVRAFAVTGSAPTPGIPLSEALAQRHVYDPALQEVDARYANVIYRHPFDQFCGADLCPLFDEAGDPIFRDGDHLSRIGGLMLADPMTTILREATGLLPVGAP